MIPEIVEKELELESENITISEIQSGDNISEYFDINNAENQKFFDLRNLITAIPKIDTSKMTSMSRAFYEYMHVNSIPQLDASKVDNVTQAFHNCIYLTNFGGLLNLGQAYSTTEPANTSRYTLDLVGSELLTHESLMNVINGLYDIASKGVQPQKLIISSWCEELPSEEEIEIATNKGWLVEINEIE